MIISHNWLKELCPHDLAAHALAERLSHAGLCVETCEPREDDWVLEVEVTANRPDCLSHVGIAREAAALTGLRVSRPEVKASEDASLSFCDLSSVKVECPDLCPHYTARVILGIKVGPSPEWMQRRLVTCGLRPVNNIVDVTNYVLLEMGQPLHAFDMARLDGRRIVVRRAEPGETMVAIDGTECRLSPEVCVIADARKPVAIAGVMGGIESEIGDSTADVLLESARFCPPNIRRTSRKLGLSSDSSYRFERGVDPENVERASRRAAQLMLEVAGGRLASGMADVRDDKPTVHKATMRFERLAMVLGLKVDPADIRRIFEGLEIEITKQTSSAVTVVIPSWRASDLAREIDLIEEVVRIHGYDRISETTRIPVTVARMSGRERCMRTARHLLAGEGFDEVVTFSLITPGKAQTAQPWHDGAPIALRNPFSADRTHLRLTNMANLLGVKAFNASHGTQRADLFELGKAYVPSNTAADEQPEEKLCLSLLTDRADGFLVLKGVLANVLEALHVEGRLSEEPAKVGPFAEGESLRLRLDDRLLGCVGMASQEIASEFDLDARPALLEVDFDLLIEKARIDAALRPVPKFPSVERDVAVVVDEAVRWSDLRRGVVESGVEQLEAFEFFDVYRGQQVPAGKKSIAFSLTFRAADRTLTGEEIDAARDRVVAALGKAFGAELR